MGEMKIVKHKIRRVGYVGVVGEEVNKIKTHCTKFSNNQKNFF